MKNLFPGYYNPSKKEFDTMWQNGLFIFDANVLLDIYRYSDETSAALLNIFETLSDKVWIPYQAAAEYHKNLSNVIATEAKSYTKASKNVSDLLEVFTTKRGHPFLDESLYVEIQQVFNKLNNELVKKQDNMTSMLTENPLKERLASILSGKIGHKFSPEELEQIYKDGEKRYLDKIPPGFADAKDKSGNDKYGDLVFWKEVLKKAELVDVPIFVITGDVKEDWFLKEMGRIISPRPELIAEAKSVKDISFYIYSTHTFFEYAKKYLDPDIKQDSIDEVKEFERVVVNNEEMNNRKAKVDEYQRNLYELLKSYNCSKSNFAELTGLYQNQGFNKWLEANGHLEKSELINLFEVLNSEFNYKNIWESFNCNREMVVPTGHVPSGVKSRKDDSNRSEE